MSNRLFREDRDYQLTSRGVSLANQAMAIMDAVSRRDIPRFKRLLDASPEIRQIFIENDQETARGIVATLLVMGAQHRGGSQR